MHRFGPHPQAFGRGPAPPNQHFPPNQFNPRMQRPQVPAQSNDSNQERRVDPRLNNRPGASSGPAAPPTQPRNYREFRMMREEQERKRREAEEKHRLQMQKYERKFDSIDENATVADSGKEDGTEKTASEKSAEEKQNESTKK